jgi:hypothetical protein
MRRIVATVLIACFAVQSLAAVGGKNAQYVGGTLAMKEKAEGKLDTSHETLLVFRAEDAAPVEIPYAAITELEYGQKVGRRVGAALGTAVINPVGLVMLFSKKRKHFLSISYMDSTGKEQAGVFELGKDTIRQMLKVIETRSGKEIQYQDDEAKKSGLGG